MIRIIRLPDCYLMIIGNVELKKTPPYIARKLALQESGFSLARPTSDVEAQADVINYRLPNNTKPLYYDIHMTTHIHENKFEFNGHVIIKFEVKTLPLNEIVIHMKELENLEIKLLNSTLGLIENNVDYDHEEETDFLIIKTKNNLVLNGIYHLDITYDGELRDDNLGFYRSSYLNDKNENIWLATTQFESVEARSAFPCYDEPQIRAPFKIKITYGKNYKAVSNMPVIETIDESSLQGYVTTSFKESPPIQTYLIAFIISDFDYVSKGVQKVYAKPNSIKDGEADLALRYGIEIIAKFEEYLGVDYFTEKMDQFALPDFDAGAMENFGIVTYREEYLLHNNATDTTQQKENVLTIISHEFAHQWFGDLVAPDWWVYLWLNEGFATLYEFQLVSLIYETDRLMDSFILNAVHPALEYDGNDVRPMSHYVESPDDIDDLFDYIAYEKAGSVLRMIQNAIGDDVWSKGLENYLKNRSLLAATPDHLHTAIQQAINEKGNIDLDIAKIMLSWETQSGYPVINVKKTNDTLTFTQERFLYDEEDKETLWYVPINFITASDSLVINTKPDLWLNQERSISLSRVKSSRNWNEKDWIVANLQQGYYYRVNYDESIWQALIDQLNECHNVIDLRSRGQLIDDSLNLARAGKISYEIPFGIVKHLKKETDYLPWAAAYGDLLLLNRWLSGLNMHAKYQKYIRTLVEPFYTHVGFEIMENEHKFNRYSRRIAINLACQFGHDDCLETTKSKLKDEKIHPDMQEAIYSNGLRGADAETYNKTIEMMLNLENQAQRTLIIRALGCAQNEANLKTFLLLAIKDEPKIRLQEKYRIFSSWTNAGHVGVKVVIDFVKEHYEDISDISSSLVRSILNNAASYISSEELTTQFIDLLDFLKAKNVIDDTHKNDYLNTVNATILWQEKNVKVIEDWLDRNRANSVVISTAVLALVFSAIIKLFF
ncbi:hypothetical protein PVAND_012529 [Polypedilum vanderplanki]|uniref:Aminopeptidase n=1 Tax=Polypedilum vanderplanki TaxID=319348 RepID=A0A9J6CMT2_POLVA|nr:hypothetical protein PVAND_012529 [Polypedilum vanderplanki]